MGPTHKHKLRYPIWKEAPGRHTRLITAGNFVTAPVFCNSTAAAGGGVKKVQRKDSVR